MFSQSNCFQIQLSKLEATSAALSAPLPEKKVQRLNHILPPSTTSPTLIGTTTAYTCTMPPKKDAKAAKTAKPSVQKVVQDKV
jgi:hypothetical protein